jgi:hypothetical protein
MPAPPRSVADRFGVACIIREDKTVTLASDHGE